MCFAQGIVAHDNVPRYDVSAFNIYDLQNTRGRVAHLASPTEMQVFTRQEKSYAIRDNFFQALAREEKRSCFSTSKWTCFSEFER